MTHDNTTHPAWLQLKLVVHIVKTTHQTFSDMSTLLQAAGQSTSPFTDLLGTISPVGMVRILAIYKSA